MPDIRITHAPIGLKDEIWRRKVETFHEHLQRQPFVFPSNYANAFLKPSFEGRFRDKKGRPVQESDNIFVAMVDGRFGGYVELSGGSLPGFPLPLVSIEDIWISPELRRTGLAKALLEYVKQLGHERDWDNLTATVWAGNEDSARLFRSAGFVTQSETFRFGPDRAARQMVPPRPAKRKALLRELVVVGGLILAMLVVAILARLLG